MLDLLCGLLFMYCTLDTSSLGIWVLLMPANWILLFFLNIMNESTSCSIWITTEIFLVPSWIQTHRGRVMQLMKQALYLQAEIVETTFVFPTLHRILKFLLFSCLWSGAPSLFCLVQKNRQVKSSLHPGKKDTDSPGFEPPTSRSNTWCIKTQDHGTLLVQTLK